MKKRNVHYMSDRDYLKNSPGTATDDVAAIPGYKGVEVQGLPQLRLDIKLNVGFFELWQKIRFLQSQSRC